MRSAALLAAVVTACCGCWSSASPDNTDAAVIDAGGVDQSRSDAPAADGPADIASDAAADAAVYALPTVVQVPAASVPASQPADTHAFCIDGIDPAGFSSNCWVIKWGRWTYWVLTYSDSRLQMLITPFDAAGAIAPGARWPLIEAGARYVHTISVDEAAQTITIAGQADNRVTVAWSDLIIDQTPPPPAPDGGADAARYPDPTALQVPRSSAPASLPAGTRVICPISGADTTPSANCWVVKWGRWTYWALSYSDNRSSLLITPYSDATTFLTTAPWPLEKPGTRYPWLASVDTSARTATFSGQAGDTVSLTWDDLRIDQP